MSSRNVLLVVWVGLGASSCVSVRVSRRETVEVRHRTVISPGTVNRSPEFTVRYLVLLVEATTRATRLQAGPARLDAIFEPDLLPWTGPSDVMGQVAKRTPGYRLTPLISVSVRSRDQRATINARNGRARLDATVRSTMMAYKDGRLLDGRFWHKGSFRYTEGRATHPVVKRWGEKYHPAAEYRLGETRCWSTKELPHGRGLAVLACVVKGV